MNISSAVAYLVSLALCMAHVCVCVCLCARVPLSAQVRLDVPPKLYASNVTVKLPVPKSAVSCSGELAQVSLLLQKLLLLQLQLLLLLQLFLLPRPIADTL